MNTHPGILALIAFTLAPISHADPNGTKIVRLAIEPPASADTEAKEWWAPLGLPRLRTSQKKTQPRILPAEDYVVDSLEVTGWRGTEIPEVAAADGKRDGLRLLRLPPKGSMFRQLLWNGSEDRYVSFRVIASEGTEILIGTAGLRLVHNLGAESLDLEWAQYQGGKSIWRPLGLGAVVDKYRGKPMAELPVITVALHNSGASWSIFADGIVVAEGLPGTKSSSPDTVIFNTGLHGMWVGGLVQSTENPIFEDQNRNFIDDDFERTELGGRLVSGAGDQEEHVELHTKWHSSRAQKHKPLNLERIPADKLLETTASKR